VNQNNQYTTFGSDSLSHDASGNLKTKGQTTYQWDVRDRLVGISGSGVTASFSYDALGRRASKTVNGQTLGYQYDGSDIIQDSNSQYLQGLGIDDVLSRTTNGNNEYYLKDHLGSTVALADQSGNLATQYSYSPYGQVSKTGTSSNSYFTYTGREDDSTGLYYYRARYYSPDLKRFTAEDPIGFGGGQSNLYGYVGGNPISFGDPSGRTIKVKGMNPAYYNAAKKYLTENSETARRIFDKLERSTTEYTVLMNPDSGNNYGYWTVYWNPKKKFSLLNCKNASQFQSAALGLLHELGHAYNYEVDPWNTYRREKFGDPKYDNEEEKFNILNNEVPAAFELGEPWRDNHEGSVFQTEDKSINGVKEHDPPKP
jgi:RHS repeat-associated protein